MRLTKLAVLVVVASFSTLALNMGQARGETYGIDYSNPSAYLQSGGQTNLTANSKKEIRKELGDLGKSLEDVKKIFKWKFDNFKTEHAKGAYLGSRTANDSIQTKMLTGCNDHANLAAAVLRMYGIPAIVVNAAGIQWSRNYVSKEKEGALEPRRRRRGKPGERRKGMQREKQRGKGNAKQGFKGHAFVEAYVDGRWILINSTSTEYVPTKYDPSNPAIPMPNPAEPIGYYAYSKGLDQASTGVHSMKDSRKKMLAIIPVIAGKQIVMPPYVIERIVPKGTRRPRST